MNQKVIPKPTLRRQILSRLKALPATYREQSSAIMTKHFDAAISGKEVLVASYIPLPWELPITTSAAQSLYLPRVIDKEVMVFCPYNPQTTRLTKDYAGVMAPALPQTSTSQKHGESKKADAKNLDLVPSQWLEDSACVVMLIPCLAVSYDGFRLGHGKGYYDRFFAHLKPYCRRDHKPRHSTTLIKIGVVDKHHVALRLNSGAEGSSWAEGSQWAEGSFAPDSWDVRVDGILTQSGLQLLAHSPTGIIS